MRLRTGRNEVARQGLKQRRLFARGSATNGRLDRGQQQSQIQSHQIDVRDGKHNFALENDALVEDVTEKIGELEAVVAEYVARRH